MFSNICVEYYTYILQFYRLLDLCIYARHKHKFYLVLLQRVFLLHVMRVFFNSIIDSDSP